MSSNYQAIFAIRYPGGTEADYCRESIEAYCYRNAHERALTLLRSAPKPDRGELFLKSVEED